MKNQFSIFSISYLENSAPDFVVLQAIDLAN